MLQFFYAYVQRQVNYTNISICQMYCLNYSVSLTALSLSTLEFQCLVWLIAGHHSWHC